MKNLNFLSKSGSQSMGLRSVTLALTVGSPSAHRRGIMLKLISVLVLIFTFGIGQMWGATTYTLIKSNSSLSNGDKVVVVMSSSTPTNGSSTGVTGWNNSKDATVSTTEANWVQYTVGSASSSGWTLYDETAKKSIASPGSSNQFLYGTAATCSVNSDGVLKCNSRFLCKNGSNYRMYSSIGTYTPFYVWKVSAGTTPTITKSSSMTTLTYSNGSPVAQNFTIGGSNLTNTVTVTAPTDYEVCKTLNGTYASSVSFTNTEVNAANKTVYIRLQSGLSAGNISSRNISIASEGATTQTIAVTGSVPYTITWMANGSEHATTYVSVGSTLTLPATDPVPNTCGCTGKVFYGWYGNGTSYKHATTAPSIAAAGNTVNADKTYYAVFADAEEGEDASSITTFASGTYYLVDTYDNKYFAASGTGANVTGVDITSAVTANQDGTISIDASNNVITAAMQYTVTKGAETATVQNVSNSSYIGGSGSTSFSTNSTNQWTVTKHSTAGRFTFVYSSRCILYRSGYNFRNYGTSNRNSSGYGQGYLFLVPTGGGTTYSNFETSCCTPLGQINGSVSVTNQRSLTLQWDKLSGVDGTTPYTITCKQGTENAGTIGDVDLSGAKATCTVTGLDCSTTYTFTITAHGDATHCDKTQENIQGTTSAAMTLPTLTYATGLTAGGANITPSWASAVSHDGSVSYVSSDPSVVQIVNASTGEAKPVGAGTATITATYAQSTNNCEASKTSNTISVSGDVTVTFNANGGGGSMDNQSIPFSTATALTANAFTTPSSCKYFYGWATSQALADAETRAYTDGQSVTITAGMNLYAIWKTYNYTVTKGTGTGAGTFSLSAENVDCGGSVTVTATPDATHKGSPTVTISPADKGEVSGTTISNITGNITVDVEFAAKANYAITWKVNGVALTGDALTGVTTSVLEGNGIENLPSVANNALNMCIPEGCTFKGWSESEIKEEGQSAPADLFSDAAHAPAINGAKTFHAVFAKQTNGVPVETLAQTLSYDTWNYEGSTTNKTSYRLFHKDAYVESASFDRSKLSKVIVYGGTFGGDSYNTLTIGDGTNTWKSVTVTGKSETGTNTYSDGTALSGTGTIRITSTCGSSSGNGTGVRISQVKIYTLEPTVDYSDYMTGCCPAHNVNITAPTNGTVEANVTRACENASVTLTITPETGYALSALMVGGNNVTASVSEGSYSFYMPDADVAVSATFAAKHHNVVFHKNDGSDATDTQDYAFGETKALKANGWSRDDYNFGGWMNAANGESSDYTDGESYTLSVDANVDLYALWIPDNTRSITYNGDAHISSYTAQPATVAEDAANIAITFALESNYELKSVAVTMGGEAIAADKIAFTQSSLTITAPAGGFTDNISITYTIEEMKYTVHFSINGNVTDKQVVRGQTLNDIPTPGALTGFTFEGWASVTLAETTTEPAPYALSKTATSYTPSEDNVTFYAVYSRVEETELDGFKLSDGTAYVGPMGTNAYFASTNEAGAEILFEEAAATAGQVYLYFYSGNNKTYIYTGTTTTSANITKTTSKASASPWTKGDEGNGKVSYTSTQNSRYIAYNNSASRFAVYNNSNYDKALTSTAAKKTIEATLYSTTAVVPVLDHITITTAPTKTAYFEGDDFDATGMVVTGTYNTGDKVLKASQYTVTPSTNLTAGTTSVTIAAVEDNTKTASQSITVTAIELTSIQITTAPTKTVYVVGQNFDPTGMVVTAHYNDNSKDKAVTGYTMTPSTSTALTAEDDHIEISYTEGGVTKTANQAITVNAALTGIEITTNPDKMTYIETETFDATGMVVTAHYNGSDDQIVTASVTWDKTGVLAALNSLENPTVETITFTYEESGAEVTTTLNVTVNPYPRYTVTFSANGTPTNVTETAGQGGVTVPANPSAVGDYTFAGWSKSQRAVESADDPALVTITAGKYYPEGTETLYAVYTMDKEDEVAGMLLSIDNGEEDDIYVGSFNDKQFTDAANAESALPLWFKDGLLFYMNGTTPTYVSNSTSGKADLTASTSKPNSAQWVRSVANGKVMFQSTTNNTRYLAHNTSPTYFRAYGDSYAHEFTVTTSSAVATFEIPFYTTAPSADVTPTISFAETSKTITVVDANGALNTCTNAMTTNSTGAVTYVSSDESIAEVAANGTVSVKAVGEVTITANVAAVAGTWKAISKSYTLTIEKAIASASFGTPATTIVYKDNTIALPATSEQAITITYSSNDNTVATIDESGNVTGVATSYGNNNQRTVTIYANWAETDYYEASTNSTRGRITVTVKNNAKTQTLSFTDEAKDFGSDQGDKVYTNTLNGAKTSVTYASSDETVAEVDENTGEVTVHTNAAGSATITATAAAGDVIEDGIRYAYAQAQDMYVISIVYPRPTISVASCEFKAPFEVALSSEATNMKMIVYTTDDTDPSYAGNNGDIYTEPIAINATTTLKAIAVSDEDEESPVATATYTQLVPEFTEWSFEDGESVAMNVEQTITASEGAVITYIISKGGVEVASATTESNVATFTLTEAGNYEVEAEAQWNVANGFVSESVSRTIHVKGAVHLPISYDGNGTEITSEPYFTVEGNYVVDNYNATYVNAPIKIKNTGSLTAAFLDEPSNVVFYLGGNGVSGSTLKVQESADGENFEDVEEYTADDIPASVVNFGNGYNGGGVKQNLNLKSTTRFVRWSYTKVNGNVALGKIAIYPKSMEPDNSYEVPVDFTGDVVVEDGVAWNITEAQTIHDLTVKQGAEVWNNAAITVNNLYIEAQEGKSGQITEDESITINGNAYYDLTLNTSGTMDNSKWYAFAVPFQVDAATGIQRLSNDGVTSNAGFNSHYVLLKYNSAAYASSGQGWEYVTRGETLEPGKFYMIALNSNEYNRVRMTKKAGTPLNNKADLNLTMVGTGAHANWNALANNALAYANVSATGENAGEGMKVQVYNSATDHYTALGFSEVTFTVGTPFFFQAAEAGTMSVNIAVSNNETVKAPARVAEATGEFQIRLGANTESYYDILYVSASEEALNEYQIGHDLAKAGVSTSVPQMYVPAYGAKLCDAEFPLVNNEATFPLTFTAPNTGTYQLYLADAPENANLYLQKNGVTVWDMTAGAYALEIESGTNTEYSLLLKIKENTMTGVDEINAEAGAQKVVIDEHVYILRGGEMYDMTGKMVK